MKGKILVITDLGHASPRIPGLFSELKKLGWEIHIYSPQMSKNQKSILSLKSIENIRLIESKSKMWYKRDYAEKFSKRIAIKLRRKLLSTNLTKRITRTMIYSESYKYVEIDHLVWVKNSRKELSEVVSENMYDFVFSSSSPIAAHIIAKQISDHFKIKWIADLRDLWSYNHTNIEKASKEQLRFEKKLFLTARQLTTVSKQLASTQKKIYKGNIEVIYNGFTAINRKKSRKTNNKISIVYTGVLEKGFHDFEILLDNIDKIDEVTNHNIRFIFAGSCCPIISGHFKMKNQIVPKFVELKGNLSRAAAHKLQNEADALLLFGWKDGKMTGLLQTKFFEYLGVKKPILLLGGSRDLEAREILKKTNTGVYLPKINDFITEVKRFSVKRTIFIKPIDKEIDSYSYKSQARKLELILAKVSKL